MPTAKSARGLVGKVAEEGFLGWRYQGLFADVCGRGSEQIDFFTENGFRNHQKQNKIDIGSLKIEQDLIFTEIGVQNHKEEARMRPKATNGARRVPKGAQMVPGGCQKELKWSPKGSPNEPGTSKKEPCGEVLILVAKRGGSTHYLWEPIL